MLKGKGINRKGRLEFVEKNKSNKKTMVIELTDGAEKELDQHIREIEKLLESEEVPGVLNKSKCKQCAYYEYCYI